VISDCATKMELSKLILRRRGVALLVFYVLFSSVCVDAIGESFLIEFWYFPISYAVSFSGPIITVSSPEDSFVNAIEGFGTDLQCFVNSCVPSGQTVCHFECWRLWMSAF
jgi:hypothetical protein